MKRRKLRIAWSVAWGVMAVLLVLLWVRSYYSAVVMSEPLSPTHAFKFVSQRGFLGGVLFNLNDAPYMNYKWGLVTSGVSGFEAPKWDFGFHQRSHYRAQFMMPYWFVLALAAAASFIGLQGKFAFSLRTLLIATTLVAVVLGLIVWLR